MSASTGKRSSTGGGASASTKKRQRKGSIPALSPTFHDAAVANCPQGRWGHTLTVTSDSQGIIIGGQGENDKIVKDAVWAVDLCMRRWSLLEPPQNSGPSPLCRTGHSTAYDPDSGKLYVFGGSKYKTWYSDIYTLQPGSADWTKIAPLGGTAPTRSYHTCNQYRHELFVFGGVYPNPDPIPDGCSNAIHIFDIDEKNWYEPIVVGDLPCPRSGHTATLVDDELIIFGGWDTPALFNDLYIFDLMMMEFRKVDAAGTAPSPRCWHSAVALPGKRVLIFGGYDGESALKDAFIFNISTQTWASAGDFPALAQCRAGHTAGLQGESAFIFGGGDNEGSYFNDVVQIPLTDLS